MDGKTLDALSVTHVSEDSTAFLAGVMPGDAMSINGKPTPNITTLRSILAPFQSANSKLSLAFIVKGNY